MLVVGTINVLIKVESQPAIVEFHVVGRLKTVAALDTNTATSILKSPDQESE